MLRMWLAIILWFSVLSDARQLHRRQRSEVTTTQRSLKNLDSQHCRDGRWRNCTCNDGTPANLTQNPCPAGSRPYRAGCKCPDGYKEVAVTGRTHGLHQVCTKEGVMIRPDCTCTDQAGTRADWTRHPCKEGHVNKCTCTKESQVKLTMLT
eukprot:GFUD01004048.1.p1 GENE.GFUD01004048.1~~GFUD01004048.1.p1  ORF type:complete len:151 (-),score=8.31 GFUD01004048.1:12-464(-)